MKKIFVLVAALLCIATLATPGYPNELRRISLFSGQAIGKLGTATTPIVANIPYGITRLSYIAKVTGAGTISVKAYGGPLGSSYIRPTSGITDNLTIVNSMTATTGDGAGGHFSTLATTALPAAANYQFVATESDNKTATLSMDLFVEYEK